MSPAAENAIREALERGFAALGAGRLEEAGRWCREALAARPDLVPGHFLVGLVATEMNDRKTAIRAFGSVTKLEPRHAAAWAQLARLFVSLGHVRRADRALAEAVAHEAGDPQVADLIGTVYTLLGEQPAAHEWYRKALAGRPDHVPFLVNHANSLIYLGRTREAETELRRALAHEPANPQAHWLLAGVRRADSREHVAQLERLIAQPNRSLHAQAFLNYALGKELEDLEDFDGAFEAYQRGARARRQTVEFDEAAEVETFAAAERVYTADWLAGRPAGDPDPAPIFVLGQPRTGTTLVERIISSHSQVHSAGELQQFGLSLRRLTDYRGPHRFSAELMVAAAALDPVVLGRAYLDAAAPRRGTLPRFVDKLPSNYLYLPLILAALPNARIVHLVRHPVDACFASFKQLFADAYPHSYDQREAARHHARYRRLMACWRERFPGRFFDLAYEDVTADLEPRARALIDSLGLPWEDACLEFHRHAGAVTTASAVQVREPAHTRSVGRWKHYRSKLEPMIETLREEGIAV